MVEGERIDLRIRHWESRLNAVRYSLRRVFDGYAMLGQNKEEVLSERIIARNHLAQALVDESIASTTGELIILESKKADSPQLSLYACYSIIKHAAEIPARIPLSPHLIAYTAELARDQHEDDILFNVLFSSVVFAEPDALATHTAIAEEG